MKKRNNYRKPYVDERSAFKINGEIRVPEVRLVGDNFDELSEAIGEKIETGVYRTRKVLDWSRAVDLDVVQISPNANPPVVKIIDYNKFLYLKKKKEKEIKGKTAKTVIKEIRFGPNTDEHDFNFKLKHAQKFLTDGAKVKAYVHFKGRTIVFKDRGQLLLLRFINELSELGAAEALPKMEGRRMIVMIAPLKKPKK
ncbi:MAG: translation initiation factor IF-3 [Saprospiraceae bacterium]|nr:translation initiation factor IF-3 [Bacteroidia bacterium]NNE14979.1 translation initiation factor IF-3 [Saprospiraceae bacterium]NNL92183.1 translation initiation factor IF-3 [Saprospiraceae bacterium]